MKILTYIVTLIFISIMNSCSILSRTDTDTGQIHIDELEQTVVPFGALPCEIQEFLHTQSEIRGRRNVEEFYNNSEHVPLTERYHHFTPRLFIFNNTYEYEYVRVGSTLWDKYFLLINKTNDITYRIRMGTPGPLFVYNNRELFMPTDFNVLSKSGDALEAFTFTRYLLDSKPSSKNR